MQKRVRSLKFENKPKELMNSSYRKVWLTRDTNSCETVPLQEPKRTNRIKCLWKRLEIYQMHRIYKTTENDKGKDKGKGKGNERR